MTYSRRLAAAAPVWLLFALVGLGQMYASLQARGVGAFTRLPFDVLAANYVWWWLVTPLIVSLAERYPFDGGRWRRSFAVHVPAALVLALVPEAIRVGVQFLSVPHGIAVGPLRMYRVNLGNRYGFEVTTYVAVAAIAAILELRQRSRERDLREARLETQLAQARLARLASQLKPHFLYNALNSVAMLIRGGEYNAALKTVVSYGELLRSVMTTTDAEVALDEEIRLVRRYVEIEQNRFAEAIAMSVDLPAALEKALVPSFVLQPLVENAMHHGFAESDKAHLAISAGRRKDSLVLQVSDDGRGLPSGWSADASRGVGLRNLRLRLQEYYGLDHRLDLTSTSGKGTTVTLEIPLRLSAVT